MAKRQHDAPPADPQTFREAYPRQLSGRVTVEAFEEIEALRDTLKLHTGEIITRGARALIQRLTPDDRRYFAESLARIRRRHAPRD